MHIAEVELLFALAFVYFRVLLTEVNVAPMLLAPLHILLRSHHDGRGKPRRPHPCADDITVYGVVVCYLIAKPVRAFQVNCTLVKVVVCDGSGALYLPTGVEK